MKNVKSINEFLNEGYGYDPAKDKYLTEKKFAVDKMIEVLDLLKKDGHLSDFDEDKMKYRFVYDIKFKDNTGLNSEEFGEELDDTFKYLGLLESIPKSKIHPGYEYESNSLLVKPKDTGGKKLYFWWDLNSKRIGEYGFSCKVKALVGDNSCNLPVLLGIGPKPNDDTITCLFWTGKSIQEAVFHMEDITEKPRSYDEPTYMWFKTDKKIDGYNFELGAMFSGNDNAGYELEEIEELQRADD